MHTRPTTDPRPPISTAALATRLLVAAVYALGAIAPLGLFTLAAPARAQTSIVDVCTGVALPRSAVTDIMRPVITGIATPLETSINSLLNILAPRLNLNATTLLNNAASGQDIRLSVRDPVQVAPRDLSIGCHHANVRIVPGPGSGKPPGVIVLKHRVADTEFDHRFGETLELESVFG